MSKFLNISLIIVALIVGMGVGYMFTPEYSKDMKDNEHTTVLGISDEEYDLRFIDAMIAHHLGALEMAQDVKENSKRTEILTLVDNIISTQQKEIDQMYSWKKDWYKNEDKVKVNEFSMYPNLGDYDDNFDLRFINAMIAHHTMATEMAEDAQKKSTKNEILNLAGAIIRDQSSEIDQMNIWREEWYGVK